MLASFFAAIAGRPRRLVFLFLLPVALAAGRASGARTVGLNAIEIYPDRNGFSYAQIANFTLNEKNEVSVCSDAAAPIDRATYHRMGKIVLAPGMYFQRDAKGVLKLTQRGDAASECMVPANLKYDKGDSLTAAQLADRAEMTGQVLAASDPPVTQPPPIKPGVVILIVAAPDQEWAEFLRAEREQDVRGWRLYFTKYPAGAHLTAAKKALAALYLEGAKTEFAGYLASKGADAPDYAKLKNARVLAEQAKGLVADDETGALGQKIHAEILGISGASAKSLSLYQAAFAKQSAGYANLVVAEKLADAAFDIDPAAPEDLDAEKQAKETRAAFDKILRDTEAQIASHHPEEAAKKIAPVRPFAEENPKVADDLHAVAALYVEEAKKDEDVPDWPKAMDDLENAIALVPSPDTQAMLASAREKAQGAANRAAADAAMRLSQQFLDDKKVIDAFEVLDNLPPAPHALVADEINTLKDQYVTEAQKAARSLQKAHQPIAGLGDELGIQQAYGYLERSSRLTSDPDIETRAALLADDLSQYYLHQGKTYAEKPDGSGVNIGWTYLSEALEFKSSATSGAVHDEMATVRVNHLLKSRLSMKVDFRDQTSRREATDFASQLTDAMANGLESSGMNVKVVRAQEATPVQPGFQIVGEVIRNEKSTSEETVPMQSFYRSGQQQMPNPEWNKVDDEYEKAKNDLDSARSALQGATARGHKKDIDQAQNTVQNDEQKVDELRKKLNMIPQYNLQAQESPYTYSRVNYHLKIVVELHFRILDSDGNATVPTVTVVKENPVTEYSVLNDVKPEDTRGVRKEGTVPNLDDLLEQTQSAARDELIKTANAKIADLPATILATADRKAQQDDRDGAAELYLLYLHSTPQSDTPERLRAGQFLLKTFNFKNLGSTEVAD